MARQRAAFLSDENISPQVVHTLRGYGYDVLDVKERRLSGFTDQKILGLAYKQKRTVLTHDRDFAHALFLPPKRHAGIVILRLPNQSPSAVAKRLPSLLQPRLLKRLRRSFILVTDDAITLVH